MLGPVQGPMLGPSRRSAIHDDASGLLALAESPDRPTSPYTATRTLLRDLTLPAVPNMDVPPSPPGTPPASAAALTEKFDHFLLLKRTQGVHFNARLASSAAMRDPSVMDKMVEFSGMGDQLVDQYVTTLPDELWDVRALPDWARKGRLRETQERVGKERERGRGEPLSFVGAGAQHANGGVRKKTRFDQ